MLSDHYSLVILHVSLFHLLINLPNFFEIIDKVYFIEAIIIDTKQIIRDCTCYKYQNMALFTMHMGRT